jgi:hypothetical protein
MVSLFPLGTSLSPVLNQKIQFARKYQPEVFASLHAVQKEVPDSVHFSSWSYPTTSHGSGRRGFLRPFHDLTLAEHEQLCRDVGMTEYQIVEREKTALSWEHVAMAANRGLTLTEHGYRG